MYRWEFMAPVHRGLHGALFLLLLLVSSASEIQAFFWTTLGLQWIWECPSSLGALASQFLTGIPGMWQRQFPGTTSWIQQAAGKHVAVTSWWFCTSSFPPYSWPARPKNFLQNFFLFKNYIFESFLSPPSAMWRDATFSELWEEPSGVIQMHF